MKAVLFKLFLCAVLTLVPGLSSAADQDDAAKAAKEILASLRDKQFETLWNSQTSEFFKSLKSAEFCRVFAGLRLAARDHRSIFR